MLTTIQKLIYKARSAKSPIFYTKFNGKPGSLLSPGTPGWEIHGLISPSQEDIVMEKNYPDSFHQTNLQQELEIRNTKRIIIVGIQSEICIDATCRRAFSLGYDVTLVRDGHSTYDSKILSAPQIIRHHNDLIGQWFADVKHEKDIQF